jgi:hypothetical protein
VVAPRARHAMVKTSTIVAASSVIAAKPGATLTDSE